MRQAARAVAAEGAAGRAAAAAATLANTRERQAEQDFALRLLLSLMREGEGPVNSSP